MDESLIEPYYSEDGITIYNADCRDVLGQLEPVDLVLKNINNSLSKQYGFSDWDSAKPDIQLLDDFRSISKYQIIFGGNHFALPPSTCWLVWDKLTGANKYADCELAWTNLQGTVRKFTYLWNGMLQGNMAHKEVRQHPTQKPLPLMKWCIGFAPDAKIILDPFMGSGTTLRAAKDLGLKAIGIEIERKYCDIAIERLRQQAFDFE